MSSPPSPDRTDPPANTAGGSVPRLEISGLSKTYGGVRVLADADLTIGAGEIHALLGANGSGKSTLVKCLTGVVAPDAGGRIALGGQIVRAGSGPNVMHELGVRVVHQDAPLIDGLPVADSVAMFRGYPRKGKFFTTSRAMTAEARAVLERLEIAVDPEAPAQKLTSAERAMVMLALAVADIDKGCRVIVLDEPTASLPASDAQRFLERMQQAAATGLAVLLVTHRLAEVSQYCHEVTVLRGGRVVRSKPARDYSESQIVEDIVGPAPEADGAIVAEDTQKYARFAAMGETPSGALLSVEDVRGDIVRGISFELEAGGILGIAGIVGSGAGELGRLIAGAQALRGGRIVLDGEELRYANDRLRDALKAGVAYVPGDRTREGGIASLSVAENMALPRLGEYCRHPRRVRSSFEDVIRMLNVRPPSADHPFGTLSGGNQQKVVVGKWMLTQPRLFVLDDPTAGVDPGAREDIYEALGALRELGTAIVLVSSEPEQLVRLSDRVLVVKDGQIAVELAGEDITVSEISRATR